MYYIFPFLSSSPWLFPSCPFCRQHSFANATFNVISGLLNLFQDKSYLLKLYKTLHPEDTAATEDSLTDVTIENVLTDNLYIIAHNKA